MSSLSVARDSGDSNVATAGTGSPCGACKFLRRKCAADCIFAPYFSSNQGPARFAAVHKVFGASNVSRLLMHLPIADRSEAVITITYEAQARIRDPVYGCVSHVFSLQQQVAYLQAQLMHVRAQLLARNIGGNSWNVAESGRYSLENSDLTKGSLDTIDCHNFGSDVISRDIHVPSIGGGGDGSEYSYKYQKNSRGDPNYCDLGELHTLAFRMMRPKIILGEEECAHAMN